MNEEERRNKLYEILSKVGTRTFANFARKKGLDIPLSYDLSPGMTVGLWISDSIIQGWLYDTEKDNEWINAWHKQVVG